ncbi:MAG: alpha/beta hydrolase [Clostridia bacterium]|nr:alpha/beta hydrolase [Clostridia bacterium]MBN2883582.1 alpha/beta hydrolase [Clostridia bacterium]
MATEIFKSDEGKILMLDFYDRMVFESKLNIRQIDIMTTAGSTHILIHGDPDKPPLVLLHGSTSNASTWLSDFEIYSRSFCIYAPDMPGDPGKSTEVRMSWKNDDYANWLLEVIDNLKINNPSLVGLSLGGWVALKFASLHPERTGNVALIAPGGIINPNMSAIFKLVKFQREGDAGVKKTLRLLFPDDFDSPEVFEFFSLINQHFISRVEAVPKLSNDELSAIRSKVLLLCGNQDALFNFKKAVKRVNKLLPNIETHIFEKGRHGLTSTAEVILPFLLR